MSQPTAIVFGVGSVRGVGGAVCKSFAREGYHVIVVGRTPAKIDTVVAEITALAVGSAEALPTDVTDETQVMAGAIGPGHRDLHGRLRQPARQARLCPLRRCQSRVAHDRAEHGS